MWHAGEQCNDSILQNHLSGHEAGQLAQKAKSDQRVVRGESHFEVHEAAPMFCKVA